jgi:hypothetical protein
VTRKDFRGQKNAKNLLNITVTYPDLFMVIYPPVTYHDMENDHFLELNHLFSWAMFNSYVILPQGISPFT